MIEFKIDLPDLKNRLNLGAIWLASFRKHVTPAIQKSTEVIEDVASGLVPTGVSGKARNSIGSRVISGAGVVVGKVESSMRRPDVYFFVMNAGRPSGRKAPSSRELVTWVQARGLPGDPVRMAFVIARSIGKKGIPGLYVMNRAYDRNRRLIDDLHKRAVNAIERDLKNAG